MKAKTGIKMLNDLVDEIMTEEEIKSLNNYCKKLNEAQRKKPFMIVSAKLAEVLNSLPYKQ